MFTDNTYNADAVAEQRRCVDCDQQYELDAGQIAWFVQREFALPKRCTACRQRRRNERAGTDWK
jgi:hypothetical protein